MPNNSYSGSTEDDELIDAVLAASRALVAVAARSLNELEEDVTLVQYRVLVELAARGPQFVADLADILGVTPSTATRMCDRLLTKGLITRKRSTSDRRLVKVSLTQSGRNLISQVTQKRREELSEILSRISPLEREPVLNALRTFADAAGTVPEQEWSLGWRLSADPREESKLK